MAALEQSEMFIDAFFFNAVEISFKVGFLTISIKISVLNCP